MTYGVGSSLASTSPPVLMEALLTALSEEFTALAPSHSSPGEGRQGGEHTAALSQQSQQWKCTASGKVAEELLCERCVCPSLSVSVCVFTWLYVSELAFMCVNLSE